MCILAWHWQPDAPTKLLLVANRDEAYDRPAEPLHQWQDAPVLAGRDLKAGGTWMGAGCHRRFAALTNYRTGAMPNPDAPSRGMLVHDFLLDSTSAHDYLLHLAPHSGRYNPFNLLVWDGTQLLGLEGRHGRIVVMEPGWGAVSNADFHTPWPKLQRLQTGLQDCLATGATDDDSLLQLLNDSTPSPDAALPNTGVGLAVERALSPVFIRTANYGTRASTVVRLGAEHAHMTELSYGAGQAVGRVSDRLDFDDIGP